MSPSGTEHRQQSDEFPYFRRRCALVHRRRPHVRLSILPHAGVDHSFAVNGEVERQHRNSRQDRLAIARIEPRPPQFRPGIGWSAAKQIVNSLRIGTVRSRHRPVSRRLPRKRAACSLSRRESIWNSRWVPTDVISERPSGSIAMPVSSLGSRGQRLRLTIRKTLPP